MKDPNFRYPGSKNPYYKKLQGLEDFTGTKAFLDEATENYAGRWKEILNTQGPLHVELGCNGGHVISRWAQQNQQQAYLGLEYKFKQAFRGFEKGNKLGLKNLAFLRANAERIDHIFAAGEVDFLYLFFPDPWSKKSQKKKRLVQADWLKKAAHTLRPGGLFEIRTDHSEYFEWMLEAIANCTEFEVLQLNRDRHAENPQPSKLEIPDVTLFEKVWIKDGIPIKQVILRRSGHD